MKLAVDSWILSLSAPYTLPLTLTALRCARLDDHRPDTTPEDSGATLSKHKSHRTLFPPSDVEAVALAARQIAFPSSFQATTAEES